MPGRMRLKGVGLPRFGLTLIGVAVICFLAPVSGLYGMGANQGAAPKVGKKSGPTAPQPAKPAVPEFIQIVVPVGTPIRSRLNLTLKSSSARAGSIFHATLIEPLVAGGQVIAPLGIPLEGFVSKVSSPGRFRGGGSLELHLQRLILPDQKSYFFSTESFVKSGRETLTRNIGLIAAGGIIGAGLGSMLGHTAGALIGVGVGGGTGTVLSWATGTTELTLPAGTELIFKLSSPVAVTIKPILTTTSGPK
ncbi:MAG: hypothetical protein HY892_21185 [Deltaproteobacteria bacterium]|nr:hypothetical protein [Deltaproteobacteria bacterium]